MKKIFKKIFSPKERSMTGELTACSTFKFEDKTKNKIKE